MDEQKLKTIVGEKLNQGLKLNDIQKLLEDEYDERLTYLDLRMLAAEIDVDWTKQDPPPPEPGDEEGENDGEETGIVEPVSDVVVTVSKIARTDAAISGSYECPSGARGEWIVDHYGRPGLIPAEGSPKPTEEEMKKFQEALVRQLQSGGMGGM
ncbi:MAG: hypothetical protein RRC34_11890 [Lentisphaeria bacterium]|nr:hypothetical protein [Lentisphaeria bacterium]